MNKNRSHPKLKKKSTFNYRNKTDDEDDFEIPQGLIDAIKEGNCVAFVGAGFCMSCNLPDWPTLLENIVDEVDPNKIKILTNKITIKDEKKVKFLRDTIQKARSTGNADLFDLVAQILEDTIGSKYVEQLVTKALEIPTDIPDAMKNRLNLLNRIPFKAILTTNFDVLTEGSTPWSVYPHDNIAYPYASILREGDKYEGSLTEINELLVAMDEKLKQDAASKEEEEEDSSNHHQHHKERTLLTSLEGCFESDEEELSSATDDVIDNITTTASASYDDIAAIASMEQQQLGEDGNSDLRRYQVRSSNNRPLIKLHGSLMVENSLVFTRTGYRKLLHQTPGYANFLRSVLATSTVLYLGFSFSDGYLNDLRGEVLSMLYGEVSSTDKEVTKKKEPIGYAIVNDKSDYEINFYQQHEGVQIIPYNTKDKSGFFGFDRRLNKIHELTSFAYRIGEITYGTRILVFELNSQGRGSIMKRALDKAIIATRVKALQNPADVFAQVGQSKIEIPPIPYQIGDLNRVLQEDVFLKYRSTYKKKKPHAHEDNPFTICESIDDVIDKLRFTANNPNTSFRYDCIITLFGEDFSKQGNALGNHKWKVLVDRMRALPVRAHTPFIVYASTGFNDPGRRRFCQSYGAYDYVTSLEMLVSSLSTLLEPLEPLKPCTNDPPNDKEYEYI